MDSNRQQIDTTRMLIARLERLSADSYWAHRSSGLRGSLLRGLEQVEHPEDSRDPAADARTLDALVRAGFHILEHAAREIRVNDPSR